MFQINHKKNAQDAPETILPPQVDISPEILESELERVSAKENKAEAATTKERNCGWAKLAIEETAADDFPLLVVSMTGGETKKLPICKVEKRPMDFGGWQELEKDRLAKREVLKYLDAALGRGFSHNCATCVHAERDAETHQLEYGTCPFYIGQYNAITADEADRPDCQAYVYCQYHAEETEEVENNPQMLKPVPKRGNVNNYLLSRRAGVDNAPALIKEMPHGAGFIE